MHTTENISPKTISKAAWTEMELVLFDLIMERRYREAAAICLDLSIEERKAWKWIPNVFKDASESEEC